MHLLTERDWTGVPYALGALFLIGAAVALLCVSIGGTSNEGPALEPTALSSAGQKPQIAVRTERAGEPFTAAGASFRVVDHPGAGWATAFEDRDPGAGKRWVVVAVEVENLGRHRFNPGLLPYLLRSRQGTLFAPQQAGVVGPSGLGLASGLPVGADAEQRLVFRLPAGLRRLTLAIQPSPARALEVRVPLAGR